MTEDMVMWAKVAAYIGAGLTMGFGAIGAAMGIGLAGAGANAGISRNPELSSNIFKTMLIGQAVTESAAIFALVVAMLLLFSSVPDSATWLNVAVSISAGLCMGFGAIGSGLGSGFPSYAACIGIGRQPSSSGRIVTNMLIGSAVCQTPAIFALVVSFILMFTDFSMRPINPTWAAILGAGFASGLGTIGSGIGGGLVAQASCDGVARKPESAGVVTNVMLLGQAVTQTTAIYGMLISFILMFKVFDPVSAGALAPAMALLAAGLCMGLGAIGPGVGEGFVAQIAVGWIAKNAGATAELTRTMLVGQAVAESTGIYSLVVALVLIFVI